MDDAEKEKEIGNAFKELQRQIVRRRILTQDYRIDGRGLRDIRTCPLKWTSFRACTFRTVPAWRNQILASPP